MREGGIVRDFTGRLALILLGAAGLLGLGRPGPAHATDIEVPVIVLDLDAAAEQESSADLDLANIVEAAAKGRTTVQEAPAIVTVITSEEILERGHSTLEQVIDTVPGWLRLGGVHNQFPFALTRGTFQGTMYMHNGLSLFEPLINVPTFGRIMPLEIIKRVELITGPGGVLWGANSYMGIANVITKDAHDVDGVEAGVRIGDGNGDREVARAYVMAGIPELAGSKKMSLFLHTNFETYLGPGFSMPALQFATPLPQPNSSLLYGPLTRAEPARSYLVNFNGKLELGPVDLTFSVPWGRLRKPVGFAGNTILNELPEDDEFCPYEEPYFDPADMCVDKGRRTRDHRPDFYDRYLTADYRTRFSKGRAGLSVKAYAVQFVRRFVLTVLPPTESLLEGGLGFTFDGTNYRTGTSVDGDVELPKNARLLYGFEAFHEWFPDRTTGSRQGEGIESTFQGPYLLDRLPMPCPVRPNGMGGTEFVDRCPLTFAFQTNRTVLGTYLNPQWRPTKKLILDGGVRVQGAPEALSGQPYSTQVLLSGALVYSFLPNWYAKLNYAEGARPPVFSNTNSNPEAAQIGGDPDLQVETSQALQAEVNARIFKGKRRIRELSFRADYSYTFLKNLIQIVAGEYQNTGDRGIHSAEFLGKLFIQGGHRLELSYTWLRINLSDKGVHRAVPEHWFNLGGVFNIIDGKLSATTNLRILGALEDANRLVEHRGWGYDDRGRVINLATGAQGNLQVGPHELVLDRLPPGADLTVGLTYTGISGMRLSAMAYNAFNARYYQADAFFDYEPRLEFLPNPYEDFRFIIDAIYSF